MQKLSFRLIASLFLSAVFLNTAARADTADFIYFCSGVNLYVKVIHVSNEGAVKINDSQFVLASDGCYALADKLNSK